VVQNHANCWLEVQRMGLKHYQLQYCTTASPLHMLPCRKPGPGGRVSIGTGPSTWDIIYHMPSSDRERPRAWAWKRRGVQASRKPREGARASILSNTPKKAFLDVPCGDGEGEEKVACEGPFNLLFRRLRRRNKVSRDVLDRARYK